VVCASSTYFVAIKMKKQVRVLALVALIIVNGITGCKEERTDRRDFKLEETDRVDKVFLSKKDGTQLLLEKKDGQWWVNNTYRAYSFNVSFLLDRTLKNLSVKRAVPQTALDEVMRQLAVNATKVEIYKDGEKDKTYYVGGNTADLRGTYMMLEGSDRPYVVHIPGFEGYLSSRFHMGVNEWIDRTVFDVKPEELASIQLVRTNPAESFIATQVKPGDYRLFTLKREPLPNVNQSALRSYFNQFEKRNWEGIPTDITRQKADSIVQLEPYIELTLTTDEQVRTLKVYRKPSYDKMHGLYDQEGNEIVYDPERYFATLSGFDQPLVIQDYVFRNIFIKREDLLQ
jgi:hypothetical protein